MKYVKIGSVLIILIRMVFILDMGYSVLFTHTHTHTCIYLHDQQSLLCIFVCKYIYNFNAKSNRIEICKQKAQIKLKLCKLRGSLVLFLHLLHTLIYIDLPLHILIHTHTHSYIYRFIYISYNNLQLKFTTRHGGKRRRSTKKNNTKKTRTQTRDIERER